MTARTKPLQVAEPVGADKASEHVKYELPPAKSAVKIISADNPGELIELLHNEARVI